MEITLTRVASTSTFFCKAIIIYSKENHKKRPLLLTTHLCSQLLQGTERTKFCLLKRKAMSISLSLNLPTPSLTNSLKLNYWSALQTWICSFQSLGLRTEQLKQLFLLWLCYFVPICLLDRFFRFWSRYTSCKITLGSIRWLLLC